MEIKVLEHTKKRIIFELIGADHTFCNGLKKELWNDASIRAAAYNIAHPLIGIPKFIVETNGQKDADEVLKAAVSRLKKHNKEFLTIFKEAKKKAK
jgi:DNA-directed RNA polymerase subunit L